MSEPIYFESKSPRFGLPFLFAAQAQKEFYINEAHALLDSLLHPVIEGTAATPPAQPESGTCWLVAADPTGEWFGHAGQIACFQSGSWLFADPCEGMRIFNRSSGTEMRYQHDWHEPTSVTVPAGGTTVDNEARAAVTELIQTLTTMGLLPHS